MRFIGKDPNIIDSYYTATAEGAITAGKPVIVEADGDVAQVSGNNLEQGTANEFDTNNSSFYAVVYDSGSERFVVVNRSSSSGPTKGRVGQINSSDNSVSFGTAVNLSGTIEALYNDGAYDANADRVLIAFRDLGASKGAAVVAEVDPSDNSISFGTKVIFEGGNTYYSTVIYDSNAQKCVVFFADQNDSMKGKARVATITPATNSVSFGTVATFESGAAEEINAVFNSSLNKHHIIYKDTDNSNYGTICTATVSGTSISFNTPVVFNSGGTVEPHVGYDATNDKLLLVFKDQSVGGSPGTAIVATAASGGTYSFGSKAVFESGATRAPNPVYNPDTGKFTVFYIDDADSDKGKFAVGTISGTTVTFEDPVIFNDADTGGSGTLYLQAAYDTTLDRNLVVYTGAPSTNRGTAKVIRNASISLTSENYIGIADDTYADNADATVAIVGCIDRNQTGLTAGQQYFVQIDGTLSTTPDTPSVLAGTAISATELVVKE